ncbi:hypothetical protein [Desulfovibrio sp. UCD-KL4C]|uniref:hypothetical protein n=1 Tax=Desulfovibrio sp. UCD-KL4C TaxID=2578120 RepID=UPI0025C1BDDD|nr:hypothetical protein [Desulfovibrio sp. UCD-KL4C]
MTDSINSISYGTDPYSAIFSKKQDEQTDSLNDISQFSKKDTIVISAEALNMYNKTTEEEAIDSNSKKSWKSFYGLETGTKTLKGNIRQVVTVNDESMEILEYHGDKLIRSVKGELTEDGAIIDTEIYDEKGEISQTINTVFQRIEDDKANQGWTAAKVTRNIQWFKDGDVTRTMSDCMKLRSQSGNVAGNIFAQTVMDKAQAESGDLSKLNNETNDKHETEYFASIQEYENKHLIRNIKIEKSDKFVNHTNRGVATKELAHLQTKEISQEREFSIEMQTYNSKGNIISNTEYDSVNKDDLRDEGGYLTQDLRVSMYNDEGELIKKSHSSVMLKESKSKKIPDSINLLNSFGMTKEQYSTPTPKTPMEILTTPSVKKTSNANNYTSVIQKEINEHNHTITDDISKYGENNREHKVSWKNEIYKDGNLMTKQEHTESATKNSRLRGLSFHTAGSLTENDNHQVTHKNSHLLESYDKGQLKHHTSVESHESITVKDKAPDEIFTITNTKEGTGFNPKKNKSIVEGELEQHDKIAHAASTAAGKEIDMALEDSAELFRSIDLEHQDAKSNKDDNKKDPDKLSMSDNN